MSAACAARNGLRSRPCLRPRWRVVAGAFLVALVGFGAIYSYAAFADAITAAFGADRVAVSMVYALSGGACFLVCGVSGRLSDRLGPRVLAATGMVVVGIGLLVAATATSLAAIYAGYGLLVGVGTGIAYAPSVAAVQRCFAVRRGLASGIAASGIGVGTALVPPASALLQGWLDWRGAFAAFGLVAFVLGSCGAMLLQPSGRRPRPRRVDVPGPPAASVPRRRYATLWLGTALASLPASLPQAMIVPSARAFGLPWAEAVALLGLIGIGTVAGRCAVAAASDMLGRRACFLACTIGMAASMLVWALATEAQTLRGFALAFGALQGGFVALLPAFAADVFGVGAIGGLIGLLYTGRAVALLAGPPALAAAAAAPGGPRIALVAVAAAGLGGTLLLARAGRAPRQGPTRAARWRRARLAPLFLLTAPAAPAFAQPGVMDLAPVWSAPASPTRARAARARLLPMRLPRDWMPGDAAAAVAGLQGDAVATALPVTDMFLAQDVAAGR